MRLKEISLAARLGLSSLAFVSGCAHSSRINQPIMVVYGHINGDGLTDAVELIESPPSTTFFVRAFAPSLSLPEMYDIRTRFGRANGSFTEPRNVFSAPGVRGLRLEDPDSDGDLDLIGQIENYTGQGNGETFEFTWYNDNGRFGNSIERIKPPIPRHLPEL